MREAERALRGLRCEDAALSQAKAESALVQVLKDDGPAGGPEEARVKEMLASLWDAVAQQKQIRHDTEELAAEGSPNEGRCRELTASQAEVRAVVDKIALALPDSAVSMPSGIEGEVSSVQRMSLVKGLLSQAGGDVLERISKKCRVRYYLFGDQLEPVGAAQGTDAASTLAAEPTAKSSRGGEAVEQAVERHSGQPVAGVVVLTDGAFNEGADALSVARAMKEKGIPLYPLGVGLEAPRDVGIRSLIVQDVMFPKDKVAVRVQVVSQGYQGNAAELRAALAGKEMVTKTIELTDGPQFVELPFEVPEGKGGTVKLEVTISGQPGEISPDNNKSEQMVKLIDQKIKVLYIEGKPRWEYRYLRVVLLRDPEARREVPDDTGRQGTRLGIRPVRCRVSIGREAGVQLRSCYPG